MRLNKKILRVGNSRGIILDKKILKRLKINDDSWVEITIKKIVGEY